MHAVGSAKDIYRFKLGIYIIGLLARFGYETGTLAHATHWTVLYGIITKQRIDIDQTGLEPVKVG